VFEINQEVIVDKQDMGFISFLDSDPHEGYYVIESEMTGTIYYIPHSEESRLEPVNV
jgi:hypothetical protein